MGENPYLAAKHSMRPQKPKQNANGQAVSKATQATGKRIGGALRAEFARLQKRKDSRPR